MWERVRGAAVHLWYQLTEWFQRVLGLGGPRRMQIAARVRPALLAQPHPGDRQDGITDVEQQEVLESTERASTQTPLAASVQVAVDARAKIVAGDTIAIETVDNSIIANETVDDEIIPNEIDDSAIIANETVESAIKSQSALAEQIVHETPGDAADAAVATVAAEPEVTIETSPEPAALSVVLGLAPTLTGLGADAGVVVPPLSTPTHPVPAQLVIPKDYIPTAESDHELYRVQVDAFAGPLDLLLFLIRRHALDIFNIPMAFICEKYLHCLKVMQELNLDVAAEFLFTASELLHIKSCMLLPRTNGEQGEEEGIDPRAELVRRLLEYERFKAAAEQLERRSWLGRDTFTRQAEVPERIDLNAPLKEVGIFALVEAFDAMFKRQGPEIRHQVVMESVSVSERMRLLVQSLPGQDLMRFEDLLGPLGGRTDVVVTFLALLELTRLQLVGLYQSLEGLLYVRRRFAAIEHALTELGPREESV
jgi:segregation and condensation protein A